MYEVVVKIIIECKLYKNLDFSYKWKHFHKKILIETKKPEGYTIEKIADNIALEFKFKIIAFLQNIANLPEIIRFYEFKSKVFT